MWAAKRSNIRRGPGTDHAKVGLLEIGDEVQVTGEIGDWLKIEAPGGGGAFVYGPLLTEEAPRRSPAAAGTDTARVLDIPDQATRDRVVDSMESCGGLQIDILDSGVTIETLRNHGELLENLEYWGKHDRTLAEMVREFLGTCRARSRLVAQSGRPCHELFRKLHETVDWVAGAIRDAEAYLDPDGQYNERERRIIEDYLRVCVTAHAAALDGNVVGPVSQMGNEPAEVATPAPAAETAQSGPLHGSIALSQESDGGYAWGIAWSFDNRASALAEARDQCREYGGSYCAEVGWFQEACGALAIGDGNGYGTGWGHTLAEAKRDALARCRVADCKVEVARCSQSQEAGGKGRKERVAARAPDAHSREAGEPGLQQKKDQIPARQRRIAADPSCADIGAAWHSAGRSISLLNPQELPSCWREITERPGCYIFGLYGERPTGWSGKCSAGVATGQGELVGNLFRDDLLDSSEGAVASFRASGRVELGKKHGRWVFQYASDSYGESTGEGSYRDGVRHGRWVYRGQYGEDSIDFDPGWIQQYPE